VREGERERKRERERREGERGNQFIKYEKQEKNSVDEQKNSLSTESHKKEKS